jgi:transcription initiation factor IIE alpha subunit
MNFFLTITAATLFAVGGATFIGCGNTESKTSEHMDHQADEKNNEVVESHKDMKMRDEENAQYQCPTKCETDKIYDEVGFCPKCEKPLEKRN